MVVKSSSTRMILNTWELHFFWLKCFVKNYIVCFDALQFKLSNWLIPIDESFLNHLNGPCLFLLDSNIESRSFVFPLFHDGRLLFHKVVLGLCL